MPPPMIKTPLQKIRWDRAKEIVEEARGPQAGWSDQEYGLAVHITQGMKWYPDDPPKKKRKKKAMSSPGWKVAFEKLAAGSKKMREFLFKELGMMTANKPDPKDVKVLFNLVEDSVRAGIRYEHRDDNHLGSDGNFKVLKTKNDKVDVVVGQRPATHWNPPEAVEETTTLSFPELVQVNDEFEYNLKSLMLRLNMNLRRISKKYPYFRLSLFMRDIEKESKPFQDWFSSLLEQDLKSMFSDTEYLGELVDTLDLEEEVEWGVSVNAVDNKWKLELVSVDVDSVKVTKGKVSVKTKTVVKADLYDWEDMEVEPYDDRDYDDDWRDDPRDWGPY